MDLQEFTSPLPKPWLNINANSVHVGPSGRGASSVQYNQLTSVTISNTSGPASLSSGSTAQGSLTLPALPVGSIIRLTAIGSMTIPAGQSSNFNLYVNGSSVAATGMASMTVTNCGTKIEAVLSVRSSTLAAPSLFVIAGASSGAAGVFQTGAANPTSVSFNPALLTNTVDIRMTQSLADPSQNFICNSFFVELLNAN